MDPTQIIQELCKRYRVSLKWGNRLRPLIERSQAVPPEASARILDLVERSFAEEARRARQEEARKRRNAAQNAAQDGLALSAVAGILHGWEPPEWLGQWDPEGAGGPSPEARDDAGPPSPEGPDEDPERRD